MSRTRASLRQAISRHIDEKAIYVGATTSAGTTTTSVASVLSAKPDDHWKGGEIVFYDGTAANLGAPRDVSDFTSSTGTVTHAALPSATASGDSFELRRHGPFYDSINDTLNEAVETVYNWFYVPLKDETLSYTTDTEEYTIPSTFALLADVQYEESGDGEGDWKSLPLSAWSVVEGDTPLLRLTSVATGKLADAQNLRLLGYRQAALLTADDDECEVPTNYIIAYCLGQLLGNFAAGPTTDPDAYSLRQRFWTEKANLERRLIKTRTAPNVRRVRW